MAHRILLSLLAASCVLHVTLAQSWLEQLEAILGITPSPSPPPGQPSPPSPPPLGIALQCPPAGTCVTKLSQAVVATPVGYWLKAPGTPTFALCARLCANVPNATYYEFVTQGIPMSERLPEDLRLVTIQKHDCYCYPQCIINIPNLPTIPTVTSIVSIPAWLKPYLPDQVIYKYSPLIVRGYMSACPSL